MEGVEEAVVVQESRSERGGAAPPPLPPYPNIGELNLDGKTDNDAILTAGNSSWATIKRAVKSPLSSAPEFEAVRPKLRRARSPFPFQRDKIDTSALK